MTALLLYLTLAVTAAVVLVLVVYLIGIIIALWGARNSLANLAGGLVAIRDNTQPLGEHLHSVNGGLSKLLGWLVAVNADLVAIVKVAQAIKQK